MVNLSVPQQAFEYRGGLTLTNEILHYALSI